VRPRRLVIFYLKCAAYKSTYLLTYLLRIFIVFLINAVRTVWRKLVQFFFIIYQVYKWINNLVTTFVFSVQAEGGRGLLSGGGFCQGAYVRGAYVLHPPATPGDSESWQALTADDPSWSLPGYSSLSASDGPPDWPIERPPSRHCYDRRYDARVCGARARRINDLTSR